MKTIEIEEKSKTRKSLVVCVVGGVAPKFFHNTFEDARNEARRLCEKEHSDAYILKVVGGYEFCQGFAEIEITDIPEENKDEVTKR